MQMCTSFIIFNIIIIIIIIAREYNDIFTAFERF